jgi:DNA helicase HerA-like ATPase
MSDESRVSEAMGIEDDGQRDGQTDAAGDASRNGARGDADPRTIGKVASPPHRESTSEQFHFWVPGDKLVEKTQIVRTDSRVGGRDISFYATVDEVYRQSRRSSIDQEFDAYDGDPDYVPELATPGVTFATASILRADPPVFTPPLDQSPVLLGGETEAWLAYGADEVENRLFVGLVKNGADVIAGPGVIDLDYLLGANGGHMNVNGVAGRGTKSSYLLFVIHQLLQETRRRARENPSDSNPMMVVPIILNVKGYDLFHIDKPSKKYDREKHLQDWKDLGVDDPQPFQNVAFYAPQIPRGNVAEQTGRDGRVEPYSWSLADVIREDLLQYLFAEEDANDPNFGALVLDLKEYLTQERTSNDGVTSRELRRGEGRPETFEELLNWLDGPAQNAVGGAHHAGTWGKLRRRLLKLVLDGEGVLRRHDQNGHPLDLGARTTQDPVVVDLNALTGKPELQRFVVATILRKLISERTGTNAQRGLTYLVALDELNRFAPKGSRDPITRLIETVAAEMRSQGIILLGAQQQASKVSDRVIEMSGIQVLGRSGSLELSQSMWRSLSQSARRKAATLTMNEKMIIQDNFREPMHVRVPFPPWAMRGEEVARDSGPDTEGPEDQDIATY